MAPISGRIGRSNFTQGNLVGPDSGALARIVQLEPIRVVFSIRPCTHKPAAGCDERNVRFAHIATEFVRQRS